MAVDSKYVVMSGDEIFDVWMIPETMGDLSDRYKEFFNSDFQIQKVYYGTEGVTSGWKFIMGTFLNPNEAVDSPFDTEEAERYAFVNDIGTVFAVIQLPKPSYVADAYNAAFYTGNLNVLDITDNLNSGIGIGWRLVDGEFVPPEES